VLASTSTRAGSTTSNSTSRGSTTWPASAAVLAMTPSTGATSASRACRLAPMSRSRAVRLASSASAASISLRGTLPSSERRRCTRWAAVARLACSSLSEDCWLALAKGSAWKRT
jgi:hypothetical protein